jgi:ABC-type transporter Mla subunit MlaD
MSSQTCINCHNSDARSPKTDWELGDVRGVLEVSSIIDAQLAHGATLGQLMMVGTGVIGLLLLGMTLWVTRTVTRPLRGMVRDMAKIATAIAAAVEEQSAATTEIARNVDHAADSTGRVAGNIGDVNRAARETSNASSQVLASARVLSGEGAKFRLTVERFLKTVRAA